MSYPALPVMEESDFCELFDEDKASSDDATAWLLELADCVTDILASFFGFTLAEPVVVFPVVFVFVSDLVFVSLGFFFSDSSSLLVSVFASFPVSFDEYVVEVADPLEEPPPPIANSFDLTTESAMAGLEVHPSIIIITAAITSTVMLHAACLLTIIVITIFTSFTSFTSSSSCCLSFVAAVGFRQLGCS